MAEHGAATRPGVGQSDGHEQRVGGYRLVRGVTVPAPPLELDEAQQRVVAHRAGPLLVLAGPGTGKTATIVAAVGDRVERRGVDPSRILVLTFSRKAAGELRERIAVRLRRTTSGPLAATFHSYAYALVRREFVLEGEQPPRLLPAAEQLMEIRRMLRGEAADGGSGWPARLRPALATRGFAEELRDLLMRAAERGMDGRRLAGFGRRRGRDDWVAAGRFLDRYAARFDLAPVPAYDYAEIVRVAAARLARKAVRRRERDAYDAVFVDEYQDCDPAQESLLQALAGDGRDLVVVGDPDQSLYGFRGADVRAITAFPQRFPAPDGSPAQVVALRTCRRSGAVLVAATRRVAARLPAPAPKGVGGRHRDLTTLPAAEPGRIRVVVAANANQEAALVADALRRAHLIDGVPWSAMAVLVRSVARQGPLLRRAMTAADIPVLVAGDDMPLAAEPGTKPLLDLVRCALRPAALDEQTAAELLTGPLGGSDALGLRRLRRGLRALATTASSTATTPGGGPTAGPASDALLARALLEPRELTLIPPGVAAPAERVGRLLSTAREAAEAGGSAEQVLWAVWNASGLAGQWQRASAAGGAAGVAADRDLDAVLALMHAAARFTDTLPPGAPGLFVDGVSGQEIAGDTLVDRAVDDAAVRVLTAHRAKGLEWDVVVVAGVQEETWPDLRLRGSLLGVDEIADATGDAGGGVAADATAATLASKLLAEERRLFYVAATRARRSLLVTAVAGEDTDAGPSRFLRELAGDDVAVEPVSGDGHRWLSLPVLTADLRRAAADRCRPLALRRAAAEQLARLAAAQVRGASPEQWYALNPLSTVQSLVSPDERVHLSPSAVETFNRCGLRWLLESAVGVRRRDAAAHLGTVIHAAAVLAARGASDADIDARIDDIWRQLDFGGAWYNTAQRQRAERMVRHFLHWHRANPRKLVAVEHELRARLGQADLRGRVDRLEEDEAGRAVVVDLKTGSSQPRGDELARNPQLGVYQLAVLLGAFEEFGLTRPGGAELVQVGKAALTDKAKVQRQAALTDDPEPDWAGDLVADVAAGMAGSMFEAKANPGCGRCPVASCCPIHPSGAVVEP